MDDPIVDVRGLAKGFGGHTVVQDITIRIGAGDMLGLVGANGGGKTTSLRMLAGLVAPDNGTGSVLGTVLGSGRIDRTRIGYMSQRLALYPELTVAENLRFHACVHGLGRAMVDDSVARYGLGAVASDRFGVLSGGWARRVQFAASVIHAPPLLLLDEPTAGLDIATRYLIWDWLFALAKAGHAIIVSTHDLTEAARLPQVVLYRDGHAAPQTTPAALMAQTGAATLEAAVLTGANR